MNKILKIFLIFMLVSFFVASNLVLAKSAPLAQESPPIPLTPEELDWLQKHPVLTLSVDDGNPPLNFRDAQGELTGISIDYMKLIAQKLGITFEFEGSTWSEALQKGLDHQVDGVVNASIKEDRLPYLNFSEPYLVLPQALVTLKDAPPISNLNQACDLRVAIIANSIRVGLFEEYCPENQIIEIENLDEGLKMISEGNADALFDELAVVQYIIEESFFSNLKIALLFYAQEEGSSRLGLRNDSPELLSVINKAIAAITEEEHRAIRLEWLRMSETVASQRELPLTADEKAWLAAHPLIWVASDPQWAPIEFVDAQGEFHGIAIEYLKYLQSALGIQFEFVKGSSMQELFAMFQDGRIDMFSALSETPNRAEQLLFTEPYLSTPIVIFTQQDITYVGSMDELNGLNVAVVDGYAIHEWLLSDYPEIQVIPVPDIQSGLELVQTGKAFAFVGNLVTTSYYIQETGYTNLKVAGDTPYANDLSMAVRNDWPELVQILQKALDSISEEERSAIVQNWVSIKYEHGFDYSLLWKIGIVVIPIFMLIFYWNRRLTSEIRRREQAEIELLNAKELAEAANQAKSTFLAHMSHELRTPLNTILGYAQLLKRAPDMPPERLDDVSAIARSGEHLLSLINDILELSKIEAGRMVLEPETFNLPGLLDGIEEMMHIQAESKNLQFRAIRAPDLPAYIKTDERKLRQVLLNLLSNAIKFTEQGRVTLRIESLAPTEEYPLGLRFEIEDTGLGVAPEEMEHLFEPFVQTSSGQNLREGTGLGLPISRDFVRMMGGDLTASSQLGVGTTFRFEIHPQVVESEPLANGLAIPQVIRLVPGQRPSDGETYRILVVDDHDDGRAVVVRLMETIGMSVREARNGQEALDQFEEWQPHLIWMDMRMPVMDGLEATRKIKAAPQGTKTIVVALTASSLEEEYQKIMASGCDEFVRKPFKDAVIFETLAKLLNLTYVYADLEENMVSAALPALAAEDLLGIPVELLQKLRSDAKIGHISGLEKTVEEITRYNQLVASSLLKMTQRYDYQGILALLLEEGTEL